MALTPVRNIIVISLLVIILAVPAVAKAVSGI